MKAQKKLSNALKVQHTYRLGFEEGKAKVVAAQTKATLLEHTNNLLKSKLRRSVQRREVLHTAPHGWRRPEMKGAICKLSACVCIVGDGRDARCFCLVHTTRCAPSA